MRISPERRALAALFGLLLTACAARTPLEIREPAATPDPTLQRLLDPRPAPYGRAWLGGDVASSTVLGDGRLLWIFGDTLLGTVEDACPPPDTYCHRDVAETEADGMIASSVALMPRDADGRFAPMRPYWPRVDGAAAPVLPTLVAGEFLWPMSLARVDDALLVSASRHTRTAGLASLGSVLLRVHDPETSPATWRWEAAPVDASHPATDDRPQLTWMTALVPDGPWIYVFGERAGGGTSETVLARFPVGDVASTTWAPRLEFLSDGGTTWAPAYDARRIHVVPGLPGTTEATVHWDRRLGWYSFRILPFTFDVRLFTATALAGPWRDRGVVYALPDRWRTPRRADGSPTFAAYAVKAHPWLGDGSDIVITYNVNLFDGTYESAAAAAEREQGFYVPQVVRVAPWAR